MKRGNFIQWPIWSLIFILFLVTSCKVNLSNKPAVVVPANFPAGSTWIRSVTCVSESIMNIALLSLDADEASRWDNYDYGVNVTLGKPVDISYLVFRVLDTQNYYFLELNGTSQAVRIGKLVAGETTILSEKPVVIEAGHPYNLGIKAKGSHLTATIDDQVVLQASDGSFDYGTVGLMVSKDAEVQFKALKVIYDP